MTKCFYIAIQLLTIGRQKVHLPLQRSAYRIMRPHGIRAQQSEANTLEYFSYTSHSYLKIFVIIN